MSTYKRNDRELNKIRSLEITPNFQPNNQSSCLVKLGNTHVCCSAILEDRVPGFLRNSGKGWLTAEYGCFHLLHQSEWTEKLQRVGNPVELKKFKDSLVEVFDVLLI